jgi:hypothetical protein
MTVVTRLFLCRLSNQWLVLILNTQEKAILGCQTLCVLVVCRQRDSQIGDSFWAAGPAVGCSYLAVVMGFSPAPESRSEGVW